MGSTQNFQDVANKVSNLMAEDMRNIQQISQQMLRHLFYFIPQSVHCRLLYAIYLFTCVRSFDRNEFVLIAVSVEI